MREAGEDVERCSEDASDVVHRLRLHGPHRVYLPTGCDWSLGAVRGSCTGLQTPALLRKKSAAAGFARPSLASSAVLRCRDQLISNSTQSPEGLLLLSRVRLAAAAMAPTPLR